MIALNPIFFFFFWATYVGNSIEKMKNRGATDFQSSQGDKERDMEAFAQG